jgi:hypothetical protein
MVTENFSISKRSLKTIAMSGDLVIVGGGMAGVCAAITAARAGIKVVLIQDRPVLGGNASSEVRLWVLGATSHMGNNNRWSREGGIIDEILVENLYRNKEGNPIIFDTITLDKVKSESNITLLLNTAVYDIEKKDEKVISKVFSFCSQNETFYEVSAPLFCDASGDGIVAYSAGAGFWIGAEDKLMYNEKFAPNPEQYGELLGHTLYFYSRDTGKPIKFIPPEYALKDITKIPRFDNICSGEHGCKFWWLEYGGRMNTIHHTEDIKWELWRVVYGVWDYIKNSGKFENVENLALEWVGTIPGKRESRRFEGHYVLKQEDIIAQRHFEDAVAFGGWAIDLHPADGVYSNESGCIQYHSKGIYEIPYRCYVSKDVSNLFLAGRCISVSHVAHGSSRVMATSALGGQAVGMAAAQCIKRNILPADIIQQGQIKDLQEALNLNGQSIPKTSIHSSPNLATSATIKASSILQLHEIAASDTWYKLHYPVAQMLPLKQDVQYSFEVAVEAAEVTSLEVELRCARKTYNYTPDVIIESLTIPLTKGKQNVQLPFSKSLSNEQYGFVTFLKNDNVAIQMSDERYTGIVSVFNKFNHAVNNKGKQTPPEDSGIEAFEFWCPDRRPNGQNIAMKISPVIAAFDAKNIINGFVRPTTSVNAWVADINDSSPKLELEWNKPQAINNIKFFFDTDYDHALESVQMGHPEDVIPFCVRNYKIIDGEGNIILEVKNNYQTLNKIELKETVITSKLVIWLERAPPLKIPVALYQVIIG